MCVYGGPGSNQEKRFWCCSLFGPRTKYKTKQEIAEWLAAVKHVDGLGAACLGCSPTLIFYSRAAVSVFFFVGAAFVCIERDRIVMINEGSVLERVGDRH